MKTSDFENRPFNRRSHSAFPADIEGFLNDSGPELSCYLSGHHSFDSKYSIPSDLNQRIHNKISPSSLINYINKSFLDPSKPDTICSQIQNSLTSRISNGSNDNPAGSIPLHRDQILILLKESEIQSFESQSFLSEYFKTLDQVRIQNPDLRLGLHTVGQFRHIQPGMVRLGIENSGIIKLNDSDLTHKILGWKKHSLFTDGLHHDYGTLKEVIGVIQRDELTNYQDSEKRQMQIDISFVSTKCILMNPILSDRKFPFGPGSPMVRLLLIEADDSERSRIETWMNKSGFDLDTTSDPKEGLFLANKIKYDLILYGLNQSISGRQTQPLIPAKEFRSNESVPVICLLQSSQLLRGLELLCSGFDGIVIKPMMPQKLRIILDSYMTKKSEPTWLQSAFKKVIQII